MSCERVDGPTAVCRTHGSPMMGASPYCVAELSRREPSTEQVLNIPSNFVVLRSRINSQVDSGTTVTLRFGHRDLLRLDLDGGTRARLECELIDVTVYPGTLEAVRAELEILRPAD